METLVNRDFASKDTIMRWRVGNVNINLTNLTVPDCVGITGMQKKENISDRYLARW